VAISMELEIAFRRKVKCTYFGPRVGQPIPAEEFAERPFPVHFSGSHSSPSTADEAGDLRLLGEVRRADREVPRPFCRRPKPSIKELVVFFVDIRRILLAIIRI